MCSASKLNKSNLVCQTINQIYFNLDPCSKPVDVRTQALPCGAEIMAVF